MTQTTTTIARFLRPFMTEVRAFMRAYIAPAEPFDFELSGASGDNTVSLPRGWKPKQTLLNGVEQRPGTGNQVTYQRDADIWQVVFATDPLVTDWIRVWAEKRP